MLVLMTWLWTTAASALVLLTLMGVQRLLVGPASGRRRERPVVLVGLTRAAVSEVREPQAA